MVFVSHIRWILNYNVESTQREDFTEVELPQEGRVLVVIEPGAEFGEDMILRFGGLFGGAINKLETVAEFPEAAVKLVGAFGVIGDESNIIPQPGKFGLGDFREGSVEGETGGAFVRDFLGCEERGLGGNEVLDGSVGALVVGADLAEMHGLTPDVFDERVSAVNLVIQVGEWTGLVFIDDESEPEAEPGDLDGAGIEIHAVDAVLDDLALKPGAVLRCVQSPIQREAGPENLLKQADGKCSGTDGGITDLNVIQELGLKTGVES